jgi:hypothetical protein
VGIASALAIWNLWRRRTAAEEPQAPAPDPADELRRKLAETRDTTASEPEATDAGVDEPSLDERRARVHAKAQEAMDAMREEPS